MNPDGRMACPQAHKKKAAAERKAADEAILSGVWTMPDSGAASPTHMVGNLNLASRIAPEAVRVKSYKGGGGRHTHHPRLRRNTTRAVAGLMILACDKCRASRQSLTRVRACLECIACAGS